MTEQTSESTYEHIYFMTLIGHILICCFQTDQISKIEMRSSHSHLHSQRRSHQTGGQWRERERQRQRDVDATFDLNAQSKDRCRF